MVENLECDIDDAMCDSITERVARLVTEHADFRKKASYVYLLFVCNHHYSQLKVVLDRF